MKEHYPDLHELLRCSTAAEGFFVQLPKAAQQAAMAQSHSIHSTHELRTFADRWGKEYRHP